jgi:HK97 family phage portal protein
MSLGQALRMTFANRSETGKMLSGSGFGWLGFGGAGVDATVANSQTAFTLSAFYNGVEQLSNDIAKLPKAVKRKNGVNREDYSDHPVNYLISNEPNSMMTAFDFWKLVVVRMIIKGNAYVEIIHNATTGRIESFIHLDSQDGGHVNVFELNNKLYYTYKGREIASENMLHYKAFSFDGKIGVSVITFAAKQLGISIDAQNYQSTVYKDRGIGYGVIESDSDVTPDNKRAIESGFTSKMSSHDKFKVPMLDNGMKYKSISISPAEAQFLESNKNGVLEVCRWLNIAPHKLKVLDNSNFSNIQSQSIEHVQDSLLPWIMRLEQETARKVFTDEEKQFAYIKFNEKVLLRGDMEARKNFYTSLVYSGVMTRNEARALEDMNPIDGLDEVLQPVNMQALSMANELFQQQINDKGNGK